VARPQLPLGRPGVTPKIDRGLDISGRWASSSLSPLDLHQGSRRILAECVPSSQRSEARRSHNRTSALALRRRNSGEVGSGGLKAGSAPRSRFSVSIRGIAQIGKGACRKDSPSCGRDGPGNVSGHRTFDQRFAAQFAIALRRNWGIADREQARARHRYRQVDGPRPLPSRQLSRLPPKIGRGRHRVRRNRPSARRHRNDAENCGRKGEFRMVRRAPHAGRLIAIQAPRGRREDSRRWHGRRRKRIGLAAPSVGIGGRAGMPAASPSSEDLVDGSRPLAAALGACERNSLV